MRPNWFIAFPVDPGTWFRARVPRPPEGLRRFHAHDLHLTVAFLGGVDEDAAGAAWAARPDLRPAFAVTLGPVVPMGNPRRYSALAAEMDVGREVVDEAIATLRAPMLAAAGAPPPRWPARAHVTLGRPKRRATSRQRAAGLRWADAVDLTGVRLALDRLALYTWSDDRAARLFRIVDEVALGA